MKTVDINILLRTLVIKKASDLHLQVGHSPCFRVHGDLHFSNLNPLSQEDVESYIHEVTNEEQWKQIKEAQHLDLSHSVDGIARFRVNVFKQRGNYGLAMRVIPFEVPTLDELGLPPLLKDLAMKPHGIVVVTGPTGSGKSTTLAAMINYINESRKAHIMTIEDPLEFLHENKNCMINQREVGLDTQSFSMALRDCLREDPVGL